MTAKYLLKLNIVIDKNFVADSYILTKNARLYNFKENFLLGKYGEYLFVIYDNAGMKIKEGNL